MRIAVLFILTPLLLSGCSLINTDSNEQPDEDIEDRDVHNQVQTPSNDKTELFSDENELINQLPEDAHLEDWNLILVNPWQALPDDFDPVLVEVDNEQRIDSRIEDAWKSWKEAANNAGHRLFFASGYRTFERQRTNFNNKVQEYRNEGLSEEEALEKTKEYLTEPGHSEHHTGLALDIVDEEWIVAGYGLVPEYDTQQSQKWLVDSMVDFGFILRYPKEKEEVTGILYESWHFRYVGVENAKFMIEHNLTLEEYLELIAKRDK